MVVDGFLAPVAYNKVLSDRLADLEASLAKKDEEGVIDSYLLRQNKELQEHVATLQQTVTSLKAELQVGCQVPGDV